MPSITSFTLSFDKVNDTGTFSEGDPISGTVSLNLNKSIKIRSLSVSATGDASTEWIVKAPEESDSTYRNDRRLFEEKELLISSNFLEKLLPPGAHSFPFHLQIPSKYMPSSFCGEYGTITYRLQAKLSRRNKKNTVEVVQFQFRSKSVPSSVVMYPFTVSTTCNGIGSYVSGTVQLTVQLQKNAFCPGETVTVTTNVANSSNHIMRTRFVLKRQELYYAGNTSVSNSDELLNRSGSLIRPQSETEATDSLVIPPAALQTIHDCPIITLAYTLATTLEVLYSDKEPRVELPLVVIAVDTRSREDFRPMEDTGEERDAAGESSVDPPFQYMDQDPDRDQSQDQDQDLDQDQSQDQDPDRDQSQDQDQDLEQDQSQD